MKYVYTNFKQCISARMKFVTNQVHKMPPCVLIIEPSKPSALCAILPLLYVIFYSTCLCVTPQSQANKEATSSVVTSSTTKVAATPQPATTAIVNQLQSAVAAPAASEVCNQQQTPTFSLTTASTSSVPSVSPPLQPRPSLPVTPVVTTAPTNLAPSTQQQFTVHGPILAPGDHGPAPNVTVNPHYQPGPSEVPPLPTRLQNAPPPVAAAASDQQIRVLTPSEIMRTLPSLCQENYEPAHSLVRACSVCEPMRFFFEPFVQFWAR